MSRLPAATSTPLKGIQRCVVAWKRFGGSLGIGYVSTSGFYRSIIYCDFTIRSALDYQPIEALKLAFSARYSDSHFEFQRDAGDRLSPLDPNQFRSAAPRPVAAYHPRVTRW
jgi:hypothetical protein